MSYHVCSDVVDVSGEAPEGYTVNEGRDSELAPNETGRRRDWNAGAGCYLSDGVDTNNRVRRATKTI